MTKGIKTLMDNKNTPHNNEQIKDDRVYNSFFYVHSPKFKPRFGNFKFIDFHKKTLSYNKESHRKKNSSLESEGKWQVIFIDLVALLLTFFVMLIASSHIDKTRWYKVVSSLEGQVKSSFVGATSFNPSQRTLVPKDQIDNRDLEYFKKILESKLTSSLLLDEVDVQLSRKGALLVIPKQAIFKGFNHEISNKGKNMLEELSEILHNLDVNISIETMTAYDNDTQKSNSKFTLNKKREISLMRSDSIRSFLINNGYSTNIAIMGSATKTANSDSEKIIFFIEKNNGASIK